LSWFGTSISKNHENQLAIGNWQSAM